jgi:hypothetical protein
MEMPSALDSLGIPCLLKFGVYIQSHNAFHLELGKFSHGNPNQYQGEHGGNTFESGGPPVCV